MLRRTLILGWLLGLMLLTGAQVARAEGQDFSLVNKTGVEIHAVYVSPSSKGDWEEDLLGGRVLSNGGTLNVTFSGDSDEELWDIRVEDSEGGALMFEGIDLMQASQVTLGSDNKAYIR